MQSNAIKVLVGIAVVVVAIVLLIVLKDSGDSGNDKTSGSNTASGKTESKDSGGSAQPEAVPTIVIEEGKPVGGIRELEYDEGERVRFKVHSDVADEVHVHGYDRMKDVEAGGTVSFDFPATIEGVFEAELEGPKEQIVELRVNP
jgi:heme/copper-type cytochrome/quinol oxidase subunit 2